MTILVQVMLKKNQQVVDTDEFPKKSWNKNEEKKVRNPFKRLNELIERNRNSNSSNHSYCLNHRILEMMMIIVFNFLNWMERRAGLLKNID